MLRSFRSFAVTTTVCLTTAAVSISALANPPLLHALRRHPSASGEVWRVVTSLFVHDAWLPLVFNLLGLAVVGAAVERRIGPLRWVLIYFVAGLIGELFGLMWQPIGAGNSVACFGLVGALFALIAKEHERTPLAAAFGLQWIVIYAGLSIAEVNGALIAALLCAPLTPAILRANGGKRGFHLSPRSAAAMAFGVALVLCLLRDIHGPPLIVGGILGVVLAI